MKNDFISYIFIAILGLFLFFLQISIFNPLPWLNLPVNYVVVLALCFSCFAGFTQRITITLYCGLLIDFWFSSCSFYTLSLLIVSGLVSYMSVRTQINYLFIIISIATGTLLTELINASFLGFCLYNTPFNPFLIYQHSILRMIAGNTLLAIIIFPILRKQFMVKTGFNRY